MTGLLPVDEALERILEGAKPLESEDVPLNEAAGRALAASIKALRTQPPFPASAMDGYAVRAADVKDVPTRLTVIGESAAGRGFDDNINALEAVRIFTGAPVPSGADTILIQENALVLDGAFIEAQTTVAEGRHIRAAGLDFRKDDTLLKKGRILDPAALSLAAAAGHAILPVTRRPRVAILATGDELVPPGGVPGPHQIVASNSFGIAALAAQDGATVHDLGIVGDDHEAIAAALREARSKQADILVTLGGASVGEHDLVKEVLEKEGMRLSFWKIAMRPGKPLLSGRLNETRVLGLPGNPVSSLVCAHLFLRPLVARLAGRTYTPDLRKATLGAPMKANDQRRDYVRASVTQGPRGLIATPFSVQDSSMLSTMAAANALIIREVGASPSAAGENCMVLILR